MPVEKKCLACNKSFSVKPSHEYRRKFCSRQCASNNAAEKLSGLNTGKGKTVICAHCGKSFYVWASRLKRLKNSSSICCSVACRSALGQSRIDSLMLKKEYESGKNIYEIADWIGVHPQTIYLRLKANGTKFRSASERMAGPNNPMYNKTHTPEAIEKIKAATARQFSIEENREKAAITSARWIASGKTQKTNTSLEIALSKILDECGIKYVQQFRVGRYVFDFKVNDQNILIEADGTFWHADPRKYPKRDKLSKTQLKNLKNDSQKNKIAIEKGFTLLRVWEEDVITNPHGVALFLTNKIQAVTP